MDTPGQAEPSDAPTNPIDPTARLKVPGHAASLEAVVQPQSIEYQEDSAVTKAEKFERHPDRDDDVPESAAKKIKLEPHPEAEIPTQSERVKGVAPIKAEYLVDTSARKRIYPADDDDAAEGAAHNASPKPDGRDKAKKKSSGQNHSRQYGHWQDEFPLCQSRALQPEFSPATCQYGEKCKFEHDLRKYLEQGRSADLTSFNGICPVWQANGECEYGWKCRFLKSHMQEKEHEDGRKELILTKRADQDSNGTKLNATASGSVNNVSTQDKINLSKRKLATPRADQYSKWLEINGKETEQYQSQYQQDDEEVGEEDVAKDNRAQYTEPPFLPSEKRKIYFGPETPVLAPLTTQGNIPFRRLCIDLGAQATYSEMAMSLPLIQGHRPEWALLRAHASETLPPAYNPQSTTVQGYDNARDSKFGAQIAANKPWQALKATEFLTKLCPHLRVIDLNCGCPIDLVYRQGAGSALLDSQGKLARMLHGMNAISDEIPITVKIRTGTKDSKPTAQKLINRLNHSGSELYCNKTPEETAVLPHSDVAAITLHGRSRQQRYTRSADWTYISECATLISNYNSQLAAHTDTVSEVDPRDQPGAKDGKVYFLGNGDCYSHTDYYTHLDSAKVDSVMIARGALIKPWIFEEISTRQYIDKSATERLDLVKDFCKFGLEHWGSDERGVGTTRRFLLEWLSFAYRYVPVGLLEYLPPSLNDRPPAWRGRTELETLLGSGNYLDWIKIRLVGLLSLYLTSGRWM